jgi:flagellar motor switch/type III secretory pathway protein FliN
MPETAAAKQIETSPADDSAAWARVRTLACELTVELILPDVKVRHLIHLQNGLVIDSRWAVGADVPVRINGTLVAWGEFEVVAGRLAVRITELAQQRSE